MTDREIVEAIQLGRNPDFAELPLIREAKEHLRRRLTLRFLTFLSFGTTKDSAEDLLHDLWLQMVRAIEEDRVEDLDALMSFAAGTAKNLRSKAIEQRAQRMRNVIPLGPYLKAKDDHERDAIERERAAELAGIFQGMLADLEPLDRSLIERFYFRGQDLERIAADLGLTPGQVRGRIERLRKQLKRDYARVKRFSPDKPLNAA